MKRRLYSVEYVKKLQKLQDAVDLYKTVNESLESKMLIIWGKFLEDNLDVYEQFMNTVENTVEDSTSFKAIVDKLDSISLQIQQLRQELRGK